MCVVLLSGCLADQSKKSKVTATVTVEAVTQTAAPNTRQDKPSDYRPECLSVRPAELTLGRIQVRYATLRSPALFRNVPTSPATLK